MDGTDRLPAAVTHDKQRPCPPWLGGMPQINLSTDCLVGDTGWLAGWLAGWLCEPDVWTAGVVPWPVSDNHGGYLPCRDKQRQLKILSCPYKGEAMSQAMIRSRVQSPIQHQPQRLHPSAHVFKQSQRLRQTQHTKNTLVGGCESFPAALQHALRMQTKARACPCTEALGTFFVREACLEALARRDHPHEGLGRHGDE